MPAPSIQPARGTTANRAKPAATATEAPSESRFVVVTTEHKGVFFGLLAKGGVDDTTLVLTNAQMCVYWSTDVKGVLGLAATGPSRSSRVTPIVPRIELSDITAVMDATEAATKAWRDLPWG